MSPRILAVIETGLKGTTGITGSLLAVILPWQEQLEWGVRMAGGFAGLIVAALSIYSIWKGLKK